MDEASGSGVSPRIDVSVVIPVHNGMPELTRTLTSVLEQSLDPCRMQIVVVDDGSTDGTADEIARVQEESGRLEVIRQPASGGPSRPRNVGLERAVGRYVFFLDADDYLADEALERLLCTAEENRADVVLGKIVRLHDLRSQSVFYRDQADAGLFSSRIGWTLNAQKLFRRELLEAAPRIRFPEEYWTGEDALFTMRCYLRAERVSVLASYPCYYKVRRPGGGQVTSRPGLEPRARATEAMLELVAAAVEAGPRRNFLLVHRMSGIVRWFGDVYLRFDDARRAEAIDLFAPLVERWVNADVLDRMKVAERLTLHLVAQRRPALIVELRRWIADGHKPARLVEGDCCYAVYPFFRDDRVRVPDELFLVDGPRRFPHTVDVLTRSGPASVRLEGRATVPASSQEARLSLVAVDRQLSRRHQQAVLSHVPVETGEGRRAAYAAEIDFGALPQEASGKRVWDLLLEVDADGTTIGQRLGRSPSGVPQVPRPWLISTRHSRFVPAGERIALRFADDGGLTLRTRAAPLRQLVADRLLRRLPLPSRVRSRLTKRLGSP